MRIDVSLGGHSTQWRMEHTIDFEAWISNGKWTDEGGLRLIRLPTASHEPAFCRRLQQALVSSGYYRDARSVQVRYPDLVDGSLSLEDLLLGSLGVSAGDKEYQRLLHASRLFDHRPIALLVSILDAADLKAVTECQEFIDRIEKVGGYRRPTILALVVGNVAPLQPSFSMTRGEPENLTLCDPDLDDRDRWQRYIHQRVAWEFGGALSLAEYWDRKLAFERLPIGNDELFENRLNHAATELLGGADVAVVEHVVNTLCSSEAFDASSWDDRNADGHHLHWWIDGAHRPTICPWLARALLIKNHFPSLCDQLRALLNCRPLASEMLYHCFTLEARERVRCSAHMEDEQNAPDGAVRSFADFKSQRGNSFARFYPSDFPVKVWSVWQFAAFGEILANTRVMSDRNQRDCQHSIRQLRNALAHGHYPAWQMLSEVVNVLRILR